MICGLAEDPEMFEALFGRKKSTQQTGHATNAPVPASAHSASRVTAPLPATMADITADWLQSVLQEHPDFRGKRITTATGVPIGEGVGQVSAIARFALTYAGAQGPEGVVVKLHPPFEAMRAVGMRYEMYRREAFFYRSLATETGAPVPTIYFSEWDPELERSATVMQDMTRWHWPDQLVGATQREAELCIDAIARLGARCWGADLSHHSWLPDTLSPVLQNIIADYRQCVPIALERLGDHLGVEAKDACQKIAQHIDWILEELAKRPLIVTHFDSRLENFVFEKPGSENLAMIDWQLVARVRPGWDFAYFVGCSIPEDLRRQLMPELKNRYLRGLRDGGVKNYDAASFDSDLRLNSMAVTLIPVIGGASFDASNARSTALFSSILQRTLGAVLDNRALELLPH